MGSDAGVSRVRYQIDCAGETYAEADGLALAVDACLRRWRESGIVQDSYIISVSDLYDEELDIYRVSIDVEFWVIN